MRAPAEAPATVPVPDFVSSALCAGGVSSPRRTIEMSSSETPRWRRAVAAAVAASASSKTATTVRAARSGTAPASPFPGSS